MFGVQELNGRSKTKKSIIISVLTIAPLNDLILNFKLVLLFGVDCRYHPVSYSSSGNWTSKF